MSVYETLGVSHHRGVVHVWNRGLNDACLNAGVGNANWSIRYELVLTATLGRDTSINSFIHGWRSQHCRETPMFRTHVGCLALIKPGSEQ